MCHDGAHRGCRRGTRLGKAPLFYDVTHVAWRGVALLCAHRVGLFIRSSSSLAQRHVSNHGDQIGYNIFLLVAKKYAAFSTTHKNRATFENTTLRLKETHNLYRFSILSDSRLPTSYFHLISFQFISFFSFYFFLCYFYIISFYFISFYFNSILSHFMSFPFYLILFNSI